MPQILIVDDDPMFRDVLRSTLEFEQLEATVAENGRRAIEIMQSNPPIILLLDLMMPDVSGYEIINWVRNQSKNTNMKIIVVTGQTNAHQKPEGKLVDAILTKPVELEKLVEQINKFLIAADVS